MTFHMSPFPHSLPLTLLLILTQLMLVAPSLQLKFHVTLLAEIFQLPPCRSPFFFLTLDFYSAPWARRQQQGGIKKSEGGGGYKAFKLGIYSIGHTLFTNWQEHHTRLWRRGGRRGHLLSGPAPALSPPPLCWNKCCPIPFISSFLQRLEVHCTRHPTPSPPLKQSQITEDNGAWRSAGILLSFLCSDLYMLEITTWRMSIVFLSNDGLCQASASALVITDGPPPCSRVPSLSHVFFYMGLTHPKASMAVECGSAPPDCSGATWGSKVN